jgi:hypothetical protein
MSDLWAQFSNDPEWASAEERVAEFKSRTPSTTKQEMVARGRELDPDVKTILDALEAVYGNGFADAVSGNVDAPTGHFYRIDRWIVITDERGFHEVWNFGSIHEAMQDYVKLDEEFAEWDGGE